MESVRLNHNALLLILAYALAVFVDFTSGMTVDVEIETQDLDDCFMHPCMNGGTCYDFSTYYRCSCTEDYEGDNCEKARGTFYNGKNYWYVSGAGSWKHFMKTCHKQGGTLATFPDGATEIAVRTKDGFIGLSATLVTGVFRWTDTSTIINYQRFLPELTFEDEKKYVFAMKSGWLPMAKDDVMSGGWCMTRDNGVTCRNKKKGCLQYDEDYFVTVPDKAPYANFELGAKSEYECESICKYNTLISCWWLHYEDNVCHMGTSEPRMSGDTAIRLRVSEDLSRGKCLEVVDQLLTHTALVEDEKNLVVIDNKKTFDQVVQFADTYSSAMWTGLTSDTKGLWKYPNGHSPTTEEWAQYPAAGSDCLALTKEGSFVQGDCDVDTYKAVIMVPGDESDCDGAPAVASAASRVILEDNIRKIQLTCSQPGQKFEATGSRLMKQRCPCGGDWTGITFPQCIDYDECLSRPCLNDGECVDGEDAYSCTCSSGFAGSTCENNLDDCASRPCQHGGTCLDQVNSYLCVCPIGFLGIHCEKDALANSRGNMDTWELLELPTPKPWTTTTKAPKPTAATTVSPAEAFNASGEGAAIQAQKSSDNALCSPPIVVLLIVTLVLILAQRPQ